jgi:hypothetical protein
MSKKEILMDAARLVSRHDHIARIKLHVAHIAEVSSREQAYSTPKRPSTKQVYAYFPNLKLRALQESASARSGPMIGSIGHFPLRRTFSTIGPAKIMGTVHKL